jgi:predicted permease
MHNLIHDVRFALRALAKRPTYTLLTVLVLGLAIGANTAVFSVFNGLFLRPLPYPADERLVVVYNSYPKAGPGMAGNSIPDYLDRREQAPSLEHLAIFRNTQLALGGDGDAERISVPRVSPSLFDVLDVSPALGRTFSDSEAEIGNERVAVISHLLWTTRFGGRQDVIGRDIRLDGEAYTIVGVMPAAFAFPDAEVRAWVPFAIAPAQRTDADRANECCGLIGRLRPGATIDGLNAELDAIVRRNAERLPERAMHWESSGFTGQARLLRDVAVGDLKPMLLLLQALVFAVLLIACANVASLQLARITARRKELVVRTVLGAHRRRLAALVTAESVALSGLGALVGICIAYAGLELVRRLGLDRSGQGFEFAMDPIVLVATAGAALFAALACALLPVTLLWRGSLARSAQEAGRLGGGGRAAHGFRSALVVTQITISVALLIGAGLLAKSFYLLQQEGAGFDAGSILTARIALPRDRYIDADARARFYEQALEELRALPGVSAAGFTSDLPFTDSNNQGTVTIDGYLPPEGASLPHAQVRSINEAFFPALGVPVVQGRNFAAREAERVVIVDQNMAQRYWPDGNALGQRVRRPFQAEDTWFTVVGVVPPIKHASLTEDPTKETIYWHYQQRADVVGVFTLRTTVPPAQLQRAASSAVLGIDPDLPVFDVQPLDQRVYASLGPQRAPMVLTLVFAGLAFTLAVVGVYGVLTWAVTQRFGEIGVRMALGARAADIVRLVMRQGAGLTLVGLLLGAGAAVALGHAMQSQLHRISSSDPMIFAIVIVGIATAASLSSWLPASRAARIDPMAALREE